MQISTAQISTLTSSAEEASVLEEIECCEAILRVRWLYFLSLSILTGVIIAALVYLTTTVQEKERRIVAAIAFGAMAAISGLGTWFFGYELQLERKKMNVLRACLHAVRAARAPV